MTVPTLSLALLLTAVAAQTTSPEAATTTWHSDDMKLDFAYPSSYTSHEDGTAKDAKPKGCVTTPVGVMDMRTDFNMIIVKHYDTVCSGNKLAAMGLDLPSQEVLLANSELDDTLSNFGKPATTSHASYQIEGHYAYLLTGSVKQAHAKGKNVLYSAVTCVLSGKDIACFEFLSNDCPTLNTIAASTITFEGSAAEPAIPANLPLGCKR